MIIPKSLADLDAYADSILAKSEETENLKPGDISQKDAVTNPAGEKQSPEEAAEETPAEEEKEEKEEKKEKEETEEPVEKSEGTTPVAAAAKDNPADGGEEKKEDEPDKESLAKSLQNEMTADEVIAKSIEASEFLQSIVSILTKSMADNAFETQVLRESSMENSGILAKSLQASLALNKSMGEQLKEVKSQNAELKKSLDSINESLGNVTSMLEEISHQPAGMRKSVSNIQTMDRNFGKSLNGVADNPMANLSKSQVMDMLTQEMYSGNQLVTPTDIISYESGAPLRPEVAGLIQSKLR